jgi:hypothetical protein
MDLTTLVVFVASAAIVGLIARGFGRRPWPWVAVAASSIGPLAIPALFVVVATSAIKKMINAKRP